LFIDFFSQTFLWNQIRRIISTVEKFSSGKTTEKEIIGALDKPEISVDFGIASAEPLILKNVFYDFEFDYAKNYLEKLEKLENKILDDLK
jgi:tRNA U38,U39,U40 pseudouridine synthase TruA